jgi:transposase
MVAAVVEQGRSITEAALAAGVSDRTCSKWVSRYRAGGDGGLRDRSSAPRHVHNRTDERTVQLLAALRRLRFTAPELADLLDMPCSTISAILKRHGMGKLGRLGMEPARRYERARPGEPAGSSCTSRSMTRPAWPTPKCSPTRKQRPRSDS